MHLLTSLCLAFLLQLQPDVFRGYERVETDVGPLFFKGWTDAEVERWTREIPVALARVELRVGKRIEAPFTIVLTPEGGEFRRVVRELTQGSEVSETVVGVAIPAYRVLAVRGGWSAGGHSIRETLLHEIAHLVIHAGVDGSVPRWFDEGVSMWASDHRLSTWDEADLSFYARVGGLYRLRALDEQFPAGHRGTVTAYSQSFLFVSFLVEEFGPEIIPEALERLSRLDLDPALSGLTGEPLAELEGRFAAWVAARRSLLWSFLGVVNFWTLAALLAIVAIVRQRWKRRQTLQRLDSQDEAENEIGAWPSA